MNNHSNMATLTRDVRSRFEKSGQKADLSHLEALLYLKRRHVTEVTTIGDLEALMGHPTQKMWRACNELKNAGLLDISVSMRDRRCRELALTDISHHILEG